MPQSPGMLRHHVPCGQLAWVERYNERQHGAGFHKVFSLAAEKEPGTGELKLAGKVHQAPETPSLSNTSRLYAQNLKTILSIHLVR